jgi:hypothetical protein
VRYLSVCSGIEAASVACFAFDFHVAAQEQPMTLSAGRHHRGKLQSPVHPIHAGHRRIVGTRGRTIPVCSMRIIRILLRTPSDECFRKAPSLPDFPMSHSVTRSVLHPAPGGAARLCFALRAPLRVSAFRKSFRQISAKNPDEKIFRTFRKSAVWPWERGTSRRFAQECPE